MRPTAPPPAIEEHEGVAILAHRRLRPARGARNSRAPQAPVSAMVDRMGQALDDLVTLLSLERIDESRFQGQSQDLGWGTVFGGQVLGQALSAAVKTAPPDREVHSLHAYFLRPGDVAKPIVYDVDRIRDGGSFTTRRVVAVQSGEAIFTMAASFHANEHGFEHQDAMPEAPPPESIPTEQQRFAESGLAHRVPRQFVERFSREQPFEVRAIDTIDHPIEPSPLPPRRLVWLKTTGRLADDPALHRYLLAYASDHGFLATSLFPHGVSFFTGQVQVASLDHAIWFHAPFRVDEWLLHAMESPLARGARGLVRGRVFTRDGRLVASTAQEGLIRRLSPKAPRV
jgi:acyl-CoA thioesterase-2